MTLLLRDCFFFRNQQENASFVGAVKSVACCVCSGAQNSGMKTQMGVGVFARCALFAVLVMAALFLHKLQHALFQDNERSQ